MKKKVTSLLFTTGLIVTLAACNFSSQSGSSSEQANQAAEANVTTTSEESTASDAAASEAGTAEEAASETDAAEAAKTETDSVESTKTEADAASAGNTGSEITPETIPQNTAAETEGTESKAEETQSTAVETEGTESKAEETQTTVSDAGLDKVEVNFSLSHENDHESAHISAVSDGAEIWSLTTDAYPSSQLDRITNIGIHGSEYYYIEDGAVVCRDLKTGNELWRNNDFNGTPAQWAYTWDENGNLLVSGYLGPDLFVCSHDGSTIKRIPTFNEDYYWPYALSYSEETKTLAITFEMAPDNGTDTLNVSLSDYTLVEGGTESSTSEEKIYYPNVSEYLSLRSEPSVEADLLRELYPGTAMKILDTQDGWAHVVVTDTGETGYVNMDYIKEVLTTGTAITDGDPFEKYEITDPAIYYPNVEEFLSLRNEPSTEADLLRELYPGTAMRIIDSADGWAHVIISDTGETGYVNMDYISTVETTGSAITDGDPFEQYDITDPTIYYPDVEEFLSLRSEPSTEADLLRELYPGTAMRIIDSADGWAHVVVSDTGESGYVNMDYIKAAE